MTAMCADSGIEYIFPHIPTSIKPHTRMKTQNTCSNNVRNFTTVKNWSVVFEILTIKNILKETHMCFLVFPFDRKNSIINIKRSHSITTLPIKYRWRASCQWHREFYMFLMGLLASSEIGNVFWGVKVCERGLRFTVWSKCIYLRWCLKDRS